MTDQAAYRRYTQKAEARFNLTENEPLTDAQALVQAAVGQGWATLALAAAQERVQPADRPTDQPAAVKDGEGDIWYLHPNGMYGLAPTARDEDVYSTLDQIAKAHGGYTEVT